MPHLTSSLLISINLIHLLLATPIFCDNATQCVGQTISANLDDVHGYGYKSIFSKISSITSSETVKCSGSFSCSEISTIMCNDVLCYGSNSCSKAKHISMRNTTNPFVYGFGARSVSNSIIKSSASSNDFKCAGDQSCADSQIEVAQNLYGSAAYSLLNATIETVGDTSIYLGGYFAGYGASFHCNSGHHCNINCAGNACFMFYIECKGTCSVNNNSVHTIGPIINTTISSINISQQLLYDTSTITSTNDATCSSQPNSLRYDNDKQRYKGANITLFSSVGYICCRGRSSCSMINIKYYSEIPQSIICSGRSSCSFSNIKTNGSVFCEASSSCWHSNIITIESVYCIASVSCAYAHIIKPFIIYCSGYRSCHLASISNTNIYFLGFESGKNGTIQCDFPHQCSIFCYGQDSCLYLSLLGDGIYNITCDEDSQCPFDIDNNPTENTSIKPSVNLNKYSTNPIINLFDQITVIIAAVLTVVIVVATLHSKKLRPNDYFSIGSLISATMQILDCISDIFYVAQITYHYEFVIVLSLTTPLLIIFILCVTFLIIPILISLVQINHIITKHWMANDELRAWLNEYIYYLYLLSFISGSSFAAVNICSSGAFGISFCNIPLSKKERKHFLYKRVYSIVVFENIPQVVMVIWFIIATQTNIDAIVYISVIFSLLSILMAIMSLYNSKKLVSTQNHCIITFNVTGNMFTDNNIDFCRENTNKIKKNIAIILGLNKSVIEIIKPKEIPNGLSITLILYIGYTAALDLNPQKLIIEANSDNSLKECIKSCWNLSSLPLIDSIHYEQHNSKNRAQKCIDIQTAASQMVDLGQPTANNDENDEYCEGNEGFIVSQKKALPQIYPTPCEEEECSNSCDRLQYVTTT